MLRWGKNLKMVSCLCIFVLIIGLLVGIMLGGKSKPKALVDEIALVRTDTVNTEGSTPSYTYSGVVKGRCESKLAFQVGGRIVSRNVNLGSYVRPGDILMRIDPIDVTRGNESAAAQVSAAQSQYQLAKDNLGRYTTLYQKGLISQVDYDRVKSSYDSASAMLRQANAQHANSQSMVSYCNLTARTGGVITSISAETGQVVGAGQPVVTIVGNNEKEVEINVPENRLEEIKNGLLSVKFWALSNTIVTGKIREISPMADPLTHTYLIRVSLLDPPSKIELGMTAEVNVIDSSHSEGVYIPLSAVYQTNNQPAVWLVKGGTVKLNPITIGEFGDDKVQVLNGLHNGDIVVIAGVHKLRAGQKVRMGAEL